MNFIDEYCSSIKDPLLSEIYSVLLESYVQWLEIQPFVVSQLVDNPQADLYGKKNVELWDSLNNKQKTNKLFEYFSKSGALAKVREYMNTSDDVLKGPTPMHYDVPEVKEPYNGNTSMHLEQFKKSKVFRDLTQIFLNYL